MVTPEDPASGKTGADLLLQPAVGCAEVSLRDGFLVNVTEFLDGLQELGG